MKRIPALALPLLLAVFALAQQQPHDPNQNPPSASPQATPESQPAQHNPQDKSSANSQIESNIESAISSDPILSGSDVKVAVDDNNITLSGSVQSQGQLNRVMALVSPYQHYRTVVNNIKVH